MNRWQSMLLSLMMLGMVPEIAHGQAWSGILDPTRAIDWSNAGVPGGIPLRNTICSTLGIGGQAPSFVQAVTVAQINAALTNCPNGQVVLLNPGTYNTTGGTIIIPSNKVLRGSGPTQTVINETGGGGGAVVQFGTRSEPSAGTNTSITGGTAKGSTSITVASTSGISVGKLLVITQTDLSYMTNQGDNGTCSWCNGGIGGDSGQVAQVTSVSGATIGISEPLYLSYTNSPLAFPYNVGCTNAGLENLKISAQNVGYNPNINFDGVTNSWVKNVESNFADGAHLYLSYSLHNTVRDSFFHDGYSHGPGGTDDQVGLQYKSSANLIENNIFWRQHVSVMLEWGASGNVIAYNYSVGNYDNVTGWMINDFNFHGAHPMMNLFEGNIEAKFEPDSTWGSSSHSTVFRNYATGSNISVPPSNAMGALQPGSGTQETGDSKGYAMDWLTQFNNMVGVIAGSGFLVNSQGASSIRKSPTVGGANPACLNVGYLSASSTAPTPNNTDATMFYHGVYNCTDGTFTWDAAHPNHNLPASFYLNGKPAWWGTIAWPPIGPDVTGGDIPDLIARGHVNAIPALNCFKIATVSGTTNTGAFDASTCYALTSTVNPPTNLSAVVH
jgi:hypothetical protein